MRMIACDTCGNAANWVVFDSVIICDVCRLGVMNWLLAQDISPFANHPFGNEFVSVQRPRAKVRVVI